MGFFEKNLEIFQNRYMWQIFSRMRLKWYIFLKMSFHLIFEVFWLKIRKKLRLEKLENMMKKRSILENAFILLKGIFNKFVARKISRRLPGVLFLMHFDKIIKIKFEVDFRKLGMPKF